MSYRTQRQLPWVSLALPVQSLNGSLHWGLPHRCTLLPLSALSGRTAPSSSAPGEDSHLPALQRSKRKFREVKTLPQGHTASSSSTMVSVLLAMHQL